LVLTDFRVVVGCGRIVGEKYLEFEIFIGWMSKVSKLSHGECKVSMWLETQRKDASETWEENLVQGYCMSLRSNNA